MGLIAFPMWLINQPFMQEYYLLFASGDLRFEIPAPPRLGKRVLEVEDIAFAYGDQLLFSDFSLIMRKGMRIGVIGSNGCGKTTLLRVLMGMEEPRKGRVRIGEATRFLYVDQGHSEINPESTILDFVSNGAHYWEVNGRRLYVPTYLERFLFDRDSIRMPIRNLSGGERNRIELARKLLQGGNFLVLDEPTNDLDLPTLRLLEEAVLGFDGCSLLVSHDRYFLNRLCTHLIAFTEGGELLFLAGNYDDYLLYRAKQRHAARPLAKPASVRAVTKRPGRRPQGLTYKERLEIEGIESSIEQAEAQVAHLEAVLNGPGFYEKEYAQVQRTLTALITVRNEVDLLYARWQELEQRRSGG
jgi:ATP-binding cassette subfamily F protein uup